ncbi:MAG: hypothetical protein ACRD6N_11440, partial [Pyrinomonadaceae bacterium]
IIATGGNLPFAVTNTIRLTPANTIWNWTPSFKLALDRNTGIFSGSFRIPGTSITRTFYGALLQNQDEGFGYFLGTTQAGEIRFVPIDPP